QRIEVRNEEGEARGLSPPLQGHLVQNQHLYEQDDAEADDVFYQRCHLSSSSFVAASRRALSSAILFSTIYTYCRLRKLTLVRRYSTCRFLLFISVVLYTIPIGTLAGKKEYSVVYTVSPFFTFIWLGTSRI